MVAIALGFSIATLATLPIFLMRSGDTRNNILFCKTINFLLLKVLGITLEIDRSEAIYDETPTVVIANHQGAMDIFSCGAVLPKRCAVLAKLSLGAIPFWGKILQNGGNILVNRSEKNDRVRALRSLRHAVCEEKASLWIFPEGTRNKGCELLEFHSGAFHTAISTKTNIQPVVISPYKKHIQFSRWKAGTIKIKVLPQISMTDIDEQTIPTVMKSTRDVMQQVFQQMDMALAN